MRQFRFPLLEIGLALLFHVLRTLANFVGGGIKIFHILRKLKQRFGGKTIRDIRFRVG